MVGIGEVCWFIVKSSFRAYNVTVSGVVLLVIEFVVNVNYEYNVKLKFFKLYLFENELGEYIVVRDFDVNTRFR